MKHKLRIIDTGLRSGRENIAFDAAMVEARKANIIPNTLRFIHFLPVALVGRHQDVSQEIKVEYCKQNNIQIGRRITGGGAIYFDQGQLGWALVCDKASLGTQNLGEITQKICQAAAAGMNKLGINCKFRPRNDIEVNGKKISGTGGFFDGDILMYQGTLLIDLDPLKMVNALNIPAHKLSQKTEQEMASRVTTLFKELGYIPDIETIKNAIISGFEDNFGFETFQDNVSAHENEIAKKIYDDEIGTDEFVYELDNLGRDEQVYSATTSTAGGVIKIYLRKEGAQNNRIREIFITGDFFVAPPRIIMDLEAHLRGTLIDDGRKNIIEFFDKLPSGSLLSITPEQFALAFEASII
jgi:lipoate---protein ligase